MTAILQAQSIVKRYNSLIAVDHISFSIAQGCCFGLLGPNGAGKTTAIEMLEGITSPTDGNILYKNQPLGDKFRAEVGIMFQTTALQDFITTSETLTLFQSLYNKTVTIDSLVESCSLQDFLDQDTRKLSGGQRQRLLLAIALINDPEFLFLDEPTTGLDPQSRRNFWELVKELKSRHKTILLTTHYMEEAYELCDEIAIMDHGKIIAKETPKQLLTEHFNGVIFQLPVDNIPKNGYQLPPGHIEKGATIEFESKDVDSTIHELLEHEVSLANLHIRQRTLDDLFIKLTGKELRS